MGTVAEATSVIAVMYAPEIRAVVGTSVAANMLYVV